MNYRKAWKVWNHTANLIAALIVAEWFYERVFVRKGIRGWLR